MDIRNHKMLTYMPQLKRYARALTGDVEQGDALTDKTLDCANSLMSFIPKDISLPVWLYSVMHNLTVDFMGEYYDNVSSKAILPYVQNEELNIEKENPNLGIKSALAHLTLEQKETVLLATLEKLSYADVCKIMGCDHVTLINRLNLARQTMCKVLFHEQFDDLQQA